MTSKDPRVPKLEMIEFVTSPVDVFSTADVSSATANCIIVRVDDIPPISFTIHEIVLCATSEFFRAAVKKEWTRALPRVIHLPDEDVIVFKIYVTWLYSHKLAIRYPVRCESANRNWELLTKSYLLGEKLIDTKFKDTIVSAMVASMRPSPIGRQAPRPGKQAIETLHEGTVRGSKARQLFAENGAAHMPLLVFTEGEDLYPYALVFEMAEVLVNKRSTDTSAKFEYVGIFVGFMSICDFCATSSSRELSNWEQIVVKGGYVCGNRKVQSLCHYKTLRSSARSGHRRRAWRTRG